MGRPKGSKNKSKVAELNKEQEELRPKPATSPTLDKLLAAGFTAADLKAAIKEALQSGEVTETADSKAELRKQMMTAPISPAEVAKLRKEAKANTPKEGHAEAVVDRAVLEVIKPSWDSSPIQGDGCKHFHVKTFRHGESVSMDKEKWDASLKKHGIRGTVQSSKSVDGLDDTSQKVSVWRVMIG